MLRANAIRGQRFQKFALIFLFLFLSIALIITWNTPATGYEASIYWSTPLIFWVCVISSVIVGIALVVLLKPSPALDCVYLWKLGLLLVFLCYAVTLGLFIIRGYYMWCMGGDPASHIGWIKETLTTGHIPNSIIYPITHIYLSEIVLITNLDLVFLHKVVPLIFDLLCVIFMYLLVRAISSNRIAPILAVLISCTLNYGWYLNLTPNGLSNLFFPLALFLIFQFLKQNKISWTILLITVVLLYPVFHPVPAIFLGLVFLTLWIPAKLPNFWRALVEKRIELPNVSKFDVELMIFPLILSVWFVFWISSFYAWDVMINSMYQTISSEGGPSKITGLVNQISYANEYGYNVVEQILKKLGGPMILVIFSVLSFPMLWKSFSKNREEKFIFSLYGPLGLLCIFIPALYVCNLAFGPLRLVIYASMLGSVFAAYFLSHHLLKNRNGTNFIKSQSVTIFTIVLLVGLFLLGLLNLYPSPYNLTQSYQTTQSEVLGMKYFYEHRDVSIPFSEITANPRRFADLLLTPEEKNVQCLPVHLLDQEKVAWHFGYDRHTWVSTSYSRETNVIITGRDKTIYKDYFPDMAQYRFTVSDFGRLNYDPSISLLYSNGGFDLWDVAVLR